MGFNASAFETLNDNYNDKYEYILDGKITNTTKIKIKCKTHGIFEQTPKNHLKGQICPKCSKGYKYGQDEFIKKCVSIHGDRFDYSKVDYKINAINIIIVSFLGSSKVLSKALDVICHKTYSSC